MSTSNNPDLNTLKNDAADEACSILEGSLEVVKVLNIKGETSQVLAAVCYAILVQRDMHFEQVLPLIESMNEKLSNMAESSDFIASEYEPKRFNKLSEIESHLIKDALTKHYLDSMTTPPEGQEHELAMLRIEHISKGMVWC